MKIGFESIISINYIERSAGFFLIDFSLTKRSNPIMSYVYENDAFSHYYDRLVNEHLPKNELWIDTVRDVYVEIIRRAILDQNRRSLVMDLGCGTGDDLIYYQKIFNNENIRWIGIDHSQSMLNRAAEKLRTDQQKSIELLQGDLTNFSSLLQGQLADCIFLSAGTFHHLISNEQRQNFLDQLQKSLKPKTGLCAIYLLPDSMVRIEINEKKKSDSDKFQLVSTNNERIENDEWICDQKFRFGEETNELFWRLRTCSASTLMKLFVENDFEVIFFCINGKDLLASDQFNSLSFIDRSTPVIIVVRRRRIN